MPGEAPSSRSHKPPTGTRTPSGEPDLRTSHGLGASSTLMISKCVFVTNPGVESCPPSMLSPTFPLRSNPTSRLPRGESADRYRYYPCTGQRAAIAIGIGYSRSTCIDCSRDVSVACPEILKGTFRDDCSLHSPAAPPPLNVPFALPSKLPSSLNVNRNLYRPHHAAVVEVLNTDVGGRGVLNREMLRLTSAALVSLEFPTHGIDPVLP